MTGYYRWDDHELYNLPHLTQNRSKKNALVHMSSSGQGVQTCHIPPHVPLYIFSFPIVRILKFKHLRSISPLRSCPTTPNLGQARHGNNQTPYPEHRIMITIKILVFSAIDLEGKFENQDFNQYFFHAKS